MTTDPPLSASVVAVLRYDATAALAALLVISAAHKQIFEWAARVMTKPKLAKTPAKTAPAPKLKAHGRNGAKPHTSAGGAYLARRREERDRDDANLIEAMQNSPSGTIKGWAAAIGKSRSSTLSALSRLRDAGRAENVEGHWRAIEEAAPPRELAQPWIRPVRGGDRAAEHHLT